MFEKVNLICVCRLLSLVCSITGCSNNEHLIKQEIESLLMNSLQGGGGYGQQQHYGGGGSYYQAQPQAQGYYGQTQQSYYGQTQQAGAYGGGYAATDAYAQQAAAGIRRRCVCNCVMIIVRHILLICYQQIPQLYQRTLLHTTLIFGITLACMVKLRRDCTIPPGLPLRVLLRQLGLCFLSMPVMVMLPPLLLLLGPLMVAIVSKQQWRQMINLPRQSLLLGRFITRSMQSG